MSCLSAALLLLLLPLVASAVPTPPKDRAVDLSALLPRALTREELAAESAKRWREARGGLLMLRAGLRYYLGWYDSALKDLRRVEDILGARPEVHALRGFILVKQEQFPTAREEFSKALALDPQNWRLLLARAGARVGGGQDDAAAEADLTRALALQPKSALAFGLRGYLRGKRKDWIAAEQDLEQSVALDPTDPRTWSGLATAQTQQNKYGEAESTLNRAIVRHPDHPGLARERGLTRINLEKFGDALVDLDRAIQAGAGDAWSHYHRGQLRQRRSDYPGALEDYERAAELNPRFALAWSRIGEVRTRARDFAGALAAYGRAIQHDPKSATTYGFRAHTHRLAGNFEAAREDGDQAVRLDPSWPTGYRQRGWALLVLGRWPEAAADFEKVRKIQPRRPDFDTLNRWMALARSGERSRADEELTAALGRPDFADPQGWPTPLAELVLGRITEDELLARAATGDEQKQAGRRCEAWYYAGLHRLLSGDETGAAAAWRKCLAEKQLDFVENDLAEAGLRQLTKRER